MEDPLPLSALLSQLLVAFTIEFDNEFEHLVPHRTTKHGSTGSSRFVPWLVSMTMWLQLMRFVPDQGIPAKELHRLTGLPTKTFRLWLTRMSKWWGYLTVSELFVRPTPGGLKALEAWRPLTAVIEKRWRERFGRDLVDQLCQIAQAIAGNLGDDYPDYLPVLGYELLSQFPALKSRTPRTTGKVSEHTLPTLLAKLLLAFAIEFERDSGLSLAVSANLLRLTSDKGIRVRDLPRLSGVSKEAVAFLLRSAEECRLGIIGKESQSSKVKMFIPTPEGQRARDTYHHMVRSIEKNWKASYGSERFEKLRTLLERIVGTSPAESSALFKGLQPYPDGWRASVPKLEQLPHYPMILHRGGFPDGS